MMRVLIGAVAVLALAACERETVAPETAKLEARTVFTGATFYTGLSETDTVTAIAVGEDGRIVWTGAQDALDVVASPAGLDVIDLGGGVGYPGFTDSHAHLIGVGERELTLDLTGTASIDELVTRIEIEAYGTPEDSVLFGRGWIETGWPDGRMPTAADLDEVIGERAVILVRADGHALVASSGALARAGITDDTPDPDGGRIERDANGKATGILVDAAMGLVLGLVSEPSEAGIIEAYATGAAVYASRGWTGMHNMSVPPAHAPIIQRLALEDRIGIRLYNAFDPEGFDIAAGRKFETPTVTNRAVKLYLDGALGSRGALLKQPYSDRPGESGLALRTKEDTLALMQRALDANVQLCVHAIGDLANAMGLDWMGEAFTARPDADPRWRIEHAQIVDPADLSRFAELGVIASMQPSHAIGDLYFAPSRLGPDRMDGAYAWRDLLDSGAVIAGGSDAPVEVGSPLIEFYAAVERRGLDGYQDENWRAGQAVTRFEALKLFTSAPAFSSFMEDDLGTLEVGKIADISVFDADLMTVPVDDILNVQARATIVGGRVIWRAEE